MAGTLVANTINTDTGLFSTNNAYSGIVKAWLVYNQTGTPSITNSFNVSSVTSNSTGNFTVNFITPMPNANYAVTGGYEGITGANVVTVYASGGGGTAPSNKTTTACQVESGGSNAYSASVIFIGN